MGKWHDIEVEDDVTAYVEYANGATGTFVTTTGDTPGTNRFEIVCDGEMEQEALAYPTLAALRGEVVPHTYSGKNVWDGFEGIDF